MRLPVSPWNSVRDEAYTPFFASIVYLAITNETVSCMAFPTDFAKAISRSSDKTAPEDCVGFPLGKGWGKQVWVVDFPVSNWFSVSVLGNFLQEIRHVLLACKAMIWGYRRFGKLPFGLLGEAYRV